jgi:hypothetical protein
VECERDTSPAKLTYSYRHVFFLTSLLGVCGGICQRALVDESGMIRTQMGTHSISQDDRSAWDALCQGNSPAHVLEEVTVMYARIIAVSAVFFLLYCLLSLSILVKLY